jgi:hypothetical protein
MMALVWELPLPPTQKFVLMAIADEANDDGYCFPSQGRLAEKCSINERSVRRMIGVSVAEGYVVVKHRFNKRGGRTSNGYQLTLKTPRTNCPGGPGADAQGDRTPVSGGRGRVRPGPPDMDVRLPTTDPLLDPTPPPPPDRNASARTADRLVSELPGGCGELSFPEAVSTAQRRTLGGHLYQLKFDDAQAIVDELAGRMVREKVFNPIRYCVAMIEKLKRGDFVPELGIPIAERRAAERLRDGVLRAQWKRTDSTSDTPRPGIPVSARAVFDRLRGAPSFDTPDVASHRKALDTSTATDATD